MCGDVADADGDYERFPAPLHWIKGNNENFDAIASGTLPANLFYLPNAEPRPSRHCESPGLAARMRRRCTNCPPPSFRIPEKTTAKATEAADRRRHFVREEVEACKALEGIDVFLSHEAPRPFRVNRGIDAGKTPINDVLAAMKPRLHLFGHHHRFTESTVRGVPSICLDLVAKSYLLIDGKTLKYQHLPSYP